MLCSGVTHPRDPVVAQALQPLLWDRRAPVELGMTLWAQLPPSWHDAG